MTLTKSWLTPPTNAATILAVLAVNLKSFTMYEETLSQPRFRP